MPILTQDIKLLKSSVMADTTDGGGQMTGVAIVDGASNNLFPDTSAMDRAFGRVNLRKVFGVAHTTDSNTLMGAHAIITDAPDDPLVACALVRTNGWADTRTTAKDVIERYVVKGPKAAVNIYDTHYAGSLQLRLISFVGATFPAGGDAVVLRNPDGVEQYVRIRTVTIDNVNVAVLEGATTTVYPAVVATCDIGQALAMDVLGAPALRVFTAASYAALYTTSVATGAKFYGVKPLGVLGTTGDLSVTVASGVYTPLVPAATIETPLLDQYPMLQYPGVSTSSSTTLTLVNPTTHAWNASNSLTLPTLIAPGSFSMTYNGTTFTDSGDGKLMQGTTEVGTIGYRTSLVQLASSAPSYGSGSAATVYYKPASPSGAACHSDLFMVTSGNQGLAYVTTLSPIPAKGTMSVSYMAQGRWYTLLDTMGGKLLGDSSAYGVGTVSYVTGSVSLTLGAIPDVDSPVIFQWGNVQACQPLPVTPPVKLSVDLEISPSAYPDSVSFEWTRGATPYTCDVSLAGVVSGAATGKMVGAGKYTIDPMLFPQSNVTVNFQDYVLDTAVTQGTGKNWTITGPVQPGTVHFTLATTAPANCVPYNSVYTQDIYDNGSGILLNTASSWSSSASSQVGTINYATGAIAITAASVSQLMLETTYHSRQVWFHTDNWTEQAWVWKPATLTATLTNMKYSGGLGTAQSTVIVPTYYVQIPTSDQSKLSLTGLTFTLGGDLYTSLGGLIRSGWNSATSAPAVASAGNVTSAGRVVLQTLPSNGTNALVWYNASIDLSGASVTSGVFRTVSAPLKAGVFQISDGVSNTANSNEGGSLVGAGWTGTVDATRGYVEWSLSSAVNPTTLRYNAVFLQYLPLDATLLGMETARLPLDGKVPIFRSGDLVVVHNTLTYTVVNPLVKDVVYSLGRNRIASVRVKDALGTLVPDTLYTVDLNLGTITVPTASNITAYTQPLMVEHRIEDMLLCSQVDISGKLSFTRSLTHDFPSNTSFVSSALPFGDLFSRAYSSFDQSTWTGAWQDTVIGTPPLSTYNTTAYPLVVTNAGAIKERWVVIFANADNFYIVGESTGYVWGGPGSEAKPKVLDAAPINPATGVPYFTVPALGWGSGWATGNCFRFNTDACGTPFWVVRTVLQGPPSLDSDQFVLAFRGDVDRP